MSLPTPPLSGDDILKQSLLKVAPTNTLLNAAIANQVIQQVNLKFMGMSLDPHKNDVNFILYVCNCVEIAFADSKNKKIRKKEIVIKCMRSFCPSITPDEIKKVEDLIEFLHSSNAIKGLEEEIIKVGRPILRRVASVFRSLAAL
jgi:hypothetical protein